MAYAYNGNYSGRPIVYPDQVPFDTDILREAQYRMVDIANLAQTVLGLPSTIGGSYPSLASGICTQQASPNMTVNLGVCTLYSLQQMEPIAYGNLGPLTTPLIFKQFTNMTAVSSGTLGTITAPSAGNWQYYLIQGTPTTTQINSVSRPYYNASNPAAPIFNTANDTEIDEITFALVAGTASAKSGGLPAIPAPTGSGIGMFLILVSDTTTSITNSLISGYPGSYVGITLPNVPGAIQTSKFNYVTDVSGAANTITINPNNPIPLAYAAGMRFDVVVANTNTSSVVVNVAGLGNKAVTSKNTNPLIGGEMPAGGISTIEYDGTEFQLLNPSHPTTISSVVASGSAVSLTTNTPVDVTSIALPAKGTYLIWANATFTLTGGTGINSNNVWINTASATPIDSSLTSINAATTPALLGTNGIPAPQRVITVSGPGTAYLSVAADFPGGAVAACGGIYATKIA